MTKELLIKKVSEMTQFEKTTIIEGIKLLPNPCSLKFKPTDVRQGDIYFCGGIGHYMVVQKVYRDTVICLMFTTKGEFPTNSRFIQGAFSRTLLGYDTTELLDKYKFVGVYGNSKHLTETYNLIKKKL